MRMAGQRDRQWNFALRLEIIDFNVRERVREKRGQDKLRGNSAALFEKIPKENLEQNCELKRENRKTTS